mmetsp:Transcript_117029/g.331199  ORF Transcript_117029/g.331199 Transcript_117029/m.331199 type:complete len:368 (-) Transcript_117029:342-1445(-)
MTTRLGCEAKHREGHEAETNAEKHRRAHHVEEETANSGRCQRGTKQDLQHKCEDDNSGAIIEEALASNEHGQPRRDAQRVEERDHRHGVGGGEYGTEEQRDGPTPTIGQNVDCNGRYEEGAQEDPGAGEDHDLGEALRSQFHIQGHGLSEEERRQERVEQNVRVDVLPHFDRIEPRLPMNDGIRRLHVVHHRDEHPGDEERASVWYAGRHALDYKKDHAPDSKDAEKEEERHVPVSLGPSVVGGVADASRDVAAAIGGQERVPQKVRAQGLRHGAPVVLVNVDHSRLRMICPEILVLLHVSDHRHILQSGERLLRVGEFLLQDRDLRLKQPGIEPRDRCVQPRTVARVIGGHVLDLRRFERFVEILA